MDYLIDKGFSVEILNRVNKKYDKSIIELLLIEKNNVLQVIDYFKEIGVKEISELFLYRLELFFIDINVIKEAMNKKSIPFFVRALNENVVYIDEL